MEIFTDHVTEWVIGLSCAFIPGVLGIVIKKTAKIPNVTIPFWLLCVFIGLVPAYFSVKHYSSQTKYIENKSYGVERVIVDGKHFYRCKFNGTELVFTGGIPPKMGFCVLINPRITFDSNAANTIDTLVEMYADPSFRPVIEPLLENIKKGGLKSSAQKN
jgi:urea transporter